MAFASQHLHPPEEKRRVIWNGDNEEGIARKRKQKKMIRLTESERKKERDRARRNNEQSFAIVIISFIKF